MSQALHRDAERLRGVCFLQAAALRRAGHLRPGRHPQPGCSGREVRRADGQHAQRRVRAIEGALTDPADQRHRGHLGRGAIQAGEEGRLAGHRLHDEPCFLQDAFEQAGIEIFTPDAEQIAYIQGRIEAELEHGIVSEPTRADFVEIIRAMHARHGIEQVILGCTELPLLLHDGNSPVPCLDTVGTHVAALVDAITRT